MKTTHLLLFLLIGAHVLVNAQITEQELLGKNIPAILIFTSTPTRQNEVEMRFEASEVFSDPYAEFLINNSKHSSQTIQGIGINGDKWLRKTDPHPKEGDLLKDKVSSYNSRLTLAYMKHEGAIEYYIITHKSFGVSFTNHYYHKIGQEPQLITRETSDSILISMISDSPEILREYQQADSLTAKNKSDKLAIIKRSDSTYKSDSKKEDAKKGFGKIIADGNQEQQLREQKGQIGSTLIIHSYIIYNYNTWYNKKHPGVVKYYFEDPPERGESQYEEQVRLNEKIEQKQRDLNEESEAKQKIADYYAMRGTVAKPDMASAKDNAPIKKETFASKLDRIKTDGNKVGVLFVLKPSKGNPKPDENGSTMQSSMSSEMANTEVYIEGEVFDESLQSLGESFTADLNTALNRTDIELIDLTKIPYRESKIVGQTMRSDNFWATKYKIVLLYTVEPLVKVTEVKSMGKSKFEAVLNFNSSVVVTEYNGAGDSKDSDKLASMLNMGFFYSPKLSQEQEIKSIDDLYSKLIEKIGMPLLEKAKIERVESFKKLVEKKLKP